MLNLAIFRDMKVSTGFMLISFR